MLLQFLSGQGASFGPWVVNNSIKWMITLFSVGSVHALLHGLPIIQKSCWTYICVIALPKWAMCQLWSMGCQEFNKKKLLVFARWGKV